MTVICSAIKGELNKTEILLYVFTFYQYNFYKINCDSFLITALKHTEEEIRCIFDDN